jgi:hypothetical protein
VNVPKEYISQHTLKFVIYTFDVLSECPQRVYIKMSFEIFMDPDDMMDVQEQELLTGDVDMDTSPGPDKIQVLVSGKVQPGKLISGLSGSKIYQTKELCLNAIDSGNFNFPFHCSEVEIISSDGVAERINAFTYLDKNSKIKYEYKPVVERKLWKELSSKVSQQLF